MSSKFAVILDNEELNSNFSTYADAETYSAQLPGSEIEEYEVPDPELVPCEFCGGTYWDTKGCTCPGYNS